MKKILLAALVGLSLVSAPAFAHGPRHPSYGYGGYGIVIPTMIGGIIGYEIAKSQQPQVVVQQPPVIVQQTPPVIVHQQPQQYCEYVVATDQFGTQRSVPYCYYK